VLWKRQETGPSLRSSKMKPSPLNSAQNSQITSGVVMTVDICMFILFQCDNDPATHHRFRVPAADAKSSQVRICPPGILLYIDTQ
jgi:hypothetical protein